MDLSIVSTVALWLAVALNLLLTLGLVRRVNALGSGGNAPEGLPPGLPDGTPLPAVDVVDLDGADIALHDLVAGPTALLFLSPTCEGCRDQLPGVRDVLGRSAGIGVVVLVPTLQAEEARAYAVDLPGATIVMAAGTRTEALRLLEVRTFPMYYTVDGNGRIAGTAFTPQQLDEAVTALQASAAQAG